MASDKNKLLNNDDGDLIYRLNHIYKGNLKYCREDEGSYKELLLQEKRVEEKLEKLEETVEPELLCGNCPGNLDCVHFTSGLKYPGCFSEQFQAYRTEKELDGLIELVKNGFKLVCCEE